MTIRYDKSGLYLKDNQQTNFVPLVLAVYHPTNQYQTQNIIIKLDILLSSGDDHILYLELEKNLSRTISKRLPFAITYSAKGERLVQQFIVDQISGLSQITHPVTDEKITICSGYAFPNNGLYLIPDHEPIIVWNHRIVGTCSSQIPYRVCDDPAVFVPNNVENPIKNMIAAIQQNDSAVCLAFIYALLISKRSVLARIGYDVQGVLYITGTQGIGKTTLAKRVLGYAVRRSDPTKPALFQEAVSTEAATRDLLARYPDLVVIFDDLCLSSVRSIEKERRKKGAFMLRLAANESQISKKAANGDTIQVNCRAGMALTAEFVMEGVSELTRCIIIDIDTPLNLSDDLNASLVGSVLNYFADWFADNYKVLIHLLSGLMEHAEGILNTFFNDDEQKRHKNLLCQQRIQHNFVLLYWAFECFITMAKQQAELTKSMEKALRRKFTDAIHHSIFKQSEILSDIQSLQPDGNLAYILSKAIDQQEFNLCRKKSKLATHEGIIWEESNDQPELIGIKETALITYVRNQNGYQNAKPRDIIQGLVDMGALVLQETKTRTVHLGKNKPGEPSIPRVLLLRYGILKTKSKNFTNQQKD